MKIRENVWISKRKDGSVWSNLSGQWKQETETSQINICQQLLSFMKKRNLDENTKTTSINYYINAYQDLMKPEKRRNH